MRLGRGDVLAQGTLGRPKQTEVLHAAAVKEFDAAVRFLRRQRYDKAKEIFEKLTSSSVSEVAARAQVYLRRCEQKLTSGGRAPAAKSAEEYYNLGVIALNARALDLAAEHLSKADKLAPDQEHVRYALAAVHTLQGNTDAALEHLRAAIKLRPNNRARARRDEDFRSLVADPRFRKL